MSLLLNTGAMHYRENVNDEWKPLVIKANADLTVLADEYSNASTYVVGEYCRYDGKLYRCTTAIATAESWTPAHWTETNIGDELESINDELENINDSYLPLTAGSDKPLTGVLVLKSSSTPQINQYNTVADTSTAPSNAINWTIFHLDKNGNPAGYWQTAYTTSGTMRTEIASVKKVNGSSVENALHLNVASDGSRSVAVTSVSAWRSALGLGTSGNLPLTIAQGGTGTTGVASTSTISEILTVGSGFSISVASYYQWGKFAQIFIRAKRVSTAYTTDSSIQVATLASGKRPPVLAAATCIDPTIKYAYIGSSGPIYAYGTWAYNVEKDIIATYILP